LWLASPRKLRRSARRKRPTIGYSRNLILGQRSPRIRAISFSIRQNKLHAKSFCARLPAATVRWNENTLSGSLAALSYFARVVTDCAKASSYQNSQTAINAFRRETLSMVGYKEFLDCARQQHFVQDPD